MKIAIDARFYGPKDTGLGRYVSRLVENLQAVDHENEYLVLMQEKDFTKLPHHDRFKRISANYGWYGLKEQLLLPFTLYRLHPDLVHFPHFNVPMLYFGPYVVTIHDLIKHEWHQAGSTTRSPWVYGLKHFVYRVVIWLAVKRAKRIFVPSNYVKQKLSTQYNLNPQKIVVTYEAGSLVDGNEQTIAEVTPASIGDKYKLKKPYVLYVGNAYPYKNLPLLFEALTKVNQKQSLNLAVVGARGVFLERLRQQAESSGSLDFINFLGYVVDEDLVALYKEATAFVLPSLSEGFGLTAVEAMGLGCPVLAANASCLPEICGEAALLFDPKESDDLAAKIWEVLDNSELRVSLAEKGLRRFREFSWRKMAQATLSVYNQVLLNL